MAYPNNIDWKVIPADQFGNPISAGNPLAVTGTTTTAPKQGSFTDRSGTITLGGTAQTLAAANASRVYLVVENSDTSANAGDLWINFGTTAVQAQPSIRIPVGATYVSDPQFISTQGVSIIGPNTGQAFTAKEA